MIVTVQVRVVPEPLGEAQVLSFWVRPAVGLTIGVISTLLTVAPVGVNDAVIVKGWGHYLMREDPAAFNAALDEALKRIAR